MRACLAALLCLAVVASGCGAGRSNGPQGAADKALLEVGPVLAGDQVVWGESAGDRILLWSGRPEEEPKLLYRKDAERKKRPDWHFKALAASPSRIAFVRDWMECWEPPPPKTPPKPNEGIEEGVCSGDNSDLWAARPGHKFAPIYESPKDCDWTGGVFGLDVSDDSVLFSEMYCRGGDKAGDRVALRDYASDTLTTLVEDAPSYSALVRVAGRYAAWSLWAPRRVVVYDRVARRVAYVAELGPRVYLDDTDFDLQEDGTIIVVYRTRAELPTRAEWYSVSSPKPHPLQLGARPHVRLSNGLFVFERSTDNSTSELVLATLDGQTRSLARFDKRTIRFGDFDFDGRLMTWATATIEKLTRRCFSHRNGGGCSSNFSGHVEVWLADTRTDAEPSLVARRPFEVLDAAALGFDEVIRYEVTG